jgi:protein O-GlcNAc transferase
MRAVRTWEAIKEQGDAHLKQGELAEAERCYRLVLESDPLDRNALVNLGFVLKELGRLPESGEFIDRALSVVPDDADAHYLRAGLDLAAGNLASSVPHLERALTLRPELEHAYREIVIALFRLGRTAEAARWCDLALARFPGSAELHFYRSNLYKHANAAEAAIASTRTALQLRPGLLAARTSLDNLLRQAPQRGAELAAGYADLGLSYLWSSEFVAAQGAFERAVTLTPEAADYHYHLGTVLRYQQGAEAAAASFERAIALDANHARARWAKALMPATPFPESRAAAQRARHEIIAGLEEFSRWSVGRDLRGEQFVGFNSPFYLSYQELDNRPVFERYGALCARAMAYLGDGKRTAPPTAAAPARSRLRIGVVSKDVRDHSVWFALIKGWFEHFDRERFEIGIFSLTATPDRETEWAKSHADFFVEGPKSLQQWVESISALHPAVLIYPAIGMDPTTLQLASLRLAQTQVTTWGHPETSGLPTMDLYLSAERFEPVDAQQFYTEKLITLPNLGNCYRGRVQQAIEPDLNALGIDAARPTLICPGTAYKYQAEYDPVLVEIARKLENSQLIFFRQRPESLSDLLEARLAQAFVRAGLDPKRHVRFIPSLPLPAFHGLLGRADLALDTLGFSGYNVAIQAVESGVPLVAYEGRFLRGRLASGILSQLGVSELVARSTDEFVGLAVKLLADPGLQRHVRGEFLRRRASLYDDVASIRYLEKLLEEQARR